ncbi:MAG TPA: acyl-CoA carboxylase subunit beta [Candidatus Nanoarchaeia archaeon]|nr:acyl-CoA carboxylase subunit beta [Candidatus Nanoarchaeia archaeon]
MVYKMTNYKEFKAKKELLVDKEGIKTQHQKGKLTARERLNLLLDENSFVELGAFAENIAYEKRKLGDGVITGYGTVLGKPIYVYAQDFTFAGGSMGEIHNKKIAEVYDLAMKNGRPIIGLLDSGGARIQEGINSLDGGGSIFLKNTQASGVIPQISIIVGPCAGIAVYSPSLTDFVFMVDKLSHMFITGPEVIKSVTNENVSFEDLGGSHVHAAKSGVAHFTAHNEKDCMLQIKRLLSYLPSNNLESPPTQTPDDNPERKNDALDKIVPLDSKKSYDVILVIKEVFDKNSFCEVQPLYAPNAVIGFGRLDGRVVGIVANQPKILAGCLDINSSDKIARFVRFCDAFNIPLINLVDVTGYLPGTNQEHNGIIRHGAKILYAYAEATVPKISLVMRKAYGGAYIALVSKSMGYDKVIAWPYAQIAVMGDEQAVNLLYRKELAASKDPKKLKNEKIQEYGEKFLNPYVAASQSKVDMIIEPKETRSTLIKTLEMISNKREKGPAKKHGNMPL